MVFQAKERAKIFVRKLAYGGIYDIIVVGEREVYWNVIQET